MELNGLINDECILNNIDDLNIEQNLYKFNCNINQNILFNILYRYDININNDIIDIIDKYFNLNNIDEPYNSIFQNYIIQDKNYNLFWITLSLYFINTLDLYEFLLSLFNISHKCNIYNNNFNINTIKKMNKNELIQLLKDYINISNLHMICFIKLFVYTFN
jgi:hypothetical protein